MDPAFFEVVDIVNRQFPDNILVLFALQPIQAVSTP
jgi:hypothetical protein